MRSIYRQLLTGALLVIYTGISLLGHGLHWFSTADHHHHGLSAVCATGHGHPHTHHHHCAHHGHESAHVAETDGDTRLFIATSDCVALWHECEICAFLFQARSQTPQVVTAIFSHPVITALAAPLQISYSPTSLGPHAPRGPPLRLS